MLIFLKNAPKVVGIQKQVLRCKEINELKVGPYHICQYIAFVTDRFINSGKRKWTEVRALLLQNLTQVKIKKYCALKLCQEVQLFKKVQYFWVNVTENYPPLQLIEIMNTLGQLFFSLVSITPYYIMDYTYVKSITSN